MSKLIDFYLYDGPTKTGHRLEQIWAWPNSKLEGVHDYIQWLFPTDEPSNFNPDAPLLDGTDLQAFRVIECLKGKLSKSFDVFLKFLGLALEDGQIVLGPDFLERKEVFEGVNHNWLRISRVIRSLRLLGLDREAEVFFAFLGRLHTEHGLISPDTMKFWEAAAVLPLEKGKPCSTDPSTT